MVLGSGRPWLERKLAESGQLERIGNFDGLPPDQHAPAGASGGIGAINLERHQATAASHVEFGSLIGADNHHVTIDHEVDRNHDRPALIDESKAAHGLARQQLEAL